MTIHPDRAADYLQHIVDAIERATSYARKAGTYDAFERDVLLQDGIIRNIGVIGEAAIKVEQIASDLLTKWPAVPWREMQTMRHKLVHDYFDIDLAIVWDTVQRDLPRLGVQINQVLASLNTNESNPKL